jgi:urocanate hydratase
MEQVLIEELRQGITDELPAYSPIPDSFSRAPIRNARLSSSERTLALRNALRYIPPALHAVLAPEFADELTRYGHIYMYRYRPVSSIAAPPISAIPARSTHAAAILHMLLNNLDPAIAQHPAELVTYGGNGSVFQNWAQFRLVTKLLLELENTQTLVLYSGHPLGVFPSSPQAPRVILTNGMMIPNYSTRENLDRLYALGVTQYGQMTAGSFMYIGPQGIVHGTTITILNAARRKARTGAGLLFVSSGLGGMSGAQAKGGRIAGVVSIVAEIDGKALQKRLSQGWVDYAYADLGDLIRHALAARSRQEAVSLAYHGNVVDLWEYLVKENVAVDLGSDQTSLHNPFGGGYYPVGIPLEESRDLMVTDPERFKIQVQDSLWRQVDAINHLASQGMYFFDYGNGFLLEARRAGAAIEKDTGEFRYPSYVEDLMGPICFDYGFGPFRWVCCSGNPADLSATDQIAAEVLRAQLASCRPSIKQQLADNIRWVEQAGEHRLVVGSQARILYADAEGRVALATAFNQAISTGKLAGPVVLGRDHHDVSGTDSPYRETADIRDGSNITADMAVHTVLGNACRGATWVSLHNGGGVGWGEVINGGFGLVLDGTPESLERARSMLHWDVLNGVARRSWAGHDGARETALKEAAQSSDLKLTIPYPVSEECLSSARVKE